MPQKILIVEDEKDLVKLLKYNLEKEGYSVSFAYDGEAGLNLFKKESADLVLLDLMLPKLDGFEFCRLVRNQSNVPIIMVTAKKDETDRVLGFGFGADDYVTKPFSIKELLARIKAILKRVSISSDNKMIFKVGDLQVDLERYQVSVKGKDVKMSAKEFSFLHNFLISNGKVLSRDTLSASKGLYVPMKGLRHTMGVLAIGPSDAKSLMDPDQLRLLETFAGEIGGALESTQMSEAIGRAEREMEMEAIHRPASDKDLRLGDVLSEERIAILPPGLSKPQIIRDLLGRLSLPNPTQAFQSILERGKAGDMLIGEDIAVPHTRMAGVKDLQVALGIDPEHSPHLWFVFVSPADDPKLHLTFLATLAAHLNDPSHLSKLKQSRSPKEVIDLLR